MSEWYALTLPEVNKLVTLTMLPMTQHCQVIDGLRLRGMADSWDCQQAERSYNELEAILSKLLEMRRKLA